METDSQPTALRCLLDSESNTRTNTTHDAPSNSNAIFSPPTQKSPGSRRPRTSPKSRMDILAYVQMAVIRLPSKNLYDWMEVYIRVLETEEESRKPTPEDAAAFQSAMVQADCPPPSTFGALFDIQNLRYSNAVLVYSVLWTSYTSKYFCLSLHAIVIIIVIRAVAIDMTSRIMGKVKLSDRYRS